MKIPDYCLIHVRHLSNKDKNKVMDSFSNTVGRDIFNIDKIKFLIFDKDDDVQIVNPDFDYDAVIHLLPSALSISDKFKKSYSEIDGRSLIKTKVIHRL